MLYGTTDQKVPGSTPGGCTNLRFCIKSNTAFSSTSIVVGFDAPPSQLRLANQPSILETILLVGPREGVEG